MTLSFPPPVTAFLAVWDNVVIGTNAEGRTNEAVLAENLTAQTAAGGLVRVAHK
jgi:hypothetical protein